VLGGTQSLHTNSYDEALGLPTEEAAVVALRTQQILASETGVAEVVDPLAGSYYVEALTDRLEAEADALIARIDAYGGAVAAIEAGFQQGEIEEAAYAQARGVESGAEVVVGVNEFVEDHVGEPAVLKVDPATEAAQIQGLQEHRDQRDGSAVTAALDSVRVSAGGEDNLLYPMREALRLGATLGEVSATLEEVFGRYRP